jgi:hypothetical protein
MRRNPAVHMVWILAGLLLASAPVWAEAVRSPAEAHAMVRGLLAGRTPPLTVGTVREAGQSYEVEVVTPGGSLVDRLLVEQASGRIRSLYGRMLASFAPDGGGGMGMMGRGPMGDGLP